MNVAMFVGHVGARTTETSARRVQFQRDRCQETKTLGTYRARRGMPPNGDPRRGWSAPSIFQRISKGRRGANSEPGYTTVTDPTIDLRVAKVVFEVGHVGLS